MSRCRREAKFFYPGLCYGIKRASFLGCCSLSRVGKASTVDQEKVNRNLNVAHISTPVPGCRLAIKAQ